MVRLSHFNTEEVSKKKIIIEFKGLAKIEKFIGYMIYAS